MVYESDIVGLLSLWLKRLKEGDHPSPYKDALEECRYELNELLENSLVKESVPQDYSFFDDLPSEEIQQYLLEQQADAYLASLEAHEKIA